MHNSLRLFAALALAFLLASGLRSRAFVLEGQQWPNGNIAMNVQMTGIVNYPLPAGGLSDGSASWNAVAQAALLLDWNPYLLNVQFTSNTNGVALRQGDGVNSVFFDSTFFGNSFGSGTLGITGRYYNPATGRTTESDTVINTAFQWDSYRGPLKSNAQNTDYIFDIRRVFDHELGHNLGLNHPDLATPPQNVTAIMNSVTSDLDHIELDDIQGVWSMYGQKTVLEPLTVTITPAAGGTVSPGTGSYQLGSTQMLVATPAPGYVFVQWDDGTTNPVRAAVTVGLSGNAYTAAFASTLDSWKNIAGGSVYNIRNLIFANGQFYGFGTNGTVTSSDGVTWTAHTTSATLSDSTNHVVYGNGLFVGDDYYGHIYKSTDGINWSTSASLGVNLSGLGFGNGLFVAGGVSNPGVTTPILTSTDGVNWTSHLTTLQGNSLNGVAYANGIYVVNGGDNTTFSTLSSTDGQTWTSTTLGFGFGPSTVTYGKGMFQASCGYGLTFESIDGVNWTATSPIGTNSNYDQVYDLGYGDGTFLALSDEIYSSLGDGTWTQRFYNGGISSGRVAYGVNTFVIQTGGSLIETSVLPPSGGPPVLPTFTSALTDSPTVGNNFTYHITATHLPLAFNAIGLPAGLSVNVTTGTISGVPSVAGTYAIKIFATNDAGSGTATLTLTVGAGAGQQLFSAWATAHNVTGDMSATPRNDGIPNLLKYLYDIDPTAPVTAAVRAATLPVVASTSSGTVMTLTFPENKILENVDVAVETSTNLTLWSPPSESEISDTGSVNVNGDHIMVARVTVTANFQFIRLVVTPQ